jgi:hypothetical protein
LVNHADYFAWVEWYSGAKPVKAQRVPFPIVPGHTMNIVVRLDTPSTATVGFEDATALTRTFVPISSPDGKAVVGKTAECIVEAPVLDFGKKGSVQANLPYYGTINASGCEVGTNSSYYAGPTTFLPIANIYETRGYYYYPGYTNQVSGRWNLLDMWEKAAGIVASFAYTTAKNGLKWESH